MMHENQSGSVLLAALGLTLVVSIIAISAMERVDLQQKMTANLKDKELSFQASESALIQGEDFLADSTEQELFGKFDNSEGLYVFDKDRQFSTDSNWTNMSTREADELHQVQTNPIYIIEELPEVRELDETLELPRRVTGRFYRVTAKSKGGTGSANTVLQSVYKK